MRILFTFLLFIICLPSYAVNDHAANNYVHQSQLGANQFDQYLPLLTNKKVGLVVNQTSTIGNNHLVDILLNKGVSIHYLFAPEDGTRGQHCAGIKVKNDTDQTTGIPIISIYGKHKHPPQQIMAELDVVIFDIQDVGARFYTYISSMHYMMEAAAEASVEFIVLDRPNPNISHTAGPVLKAEYQSFVGMHPIPLLHGMTVGELARMIVGEHWLTSTNPINLKVIPVENYKRTDLYQLPIAPSPNLPNQQAILNYPSLCLFEATPVSVGRGTDWPFQVIGHDQVHLGSFTFTPQKRLTQSYSPKLNGKQISGLDLRTRGLSGFDIQLLKNTFEQFQKMTQPPIRFFQRPNFFDKLAGTDQLRLDLLAGKSVKEIEQSWQEDLLKFKQRRKAYLLY